MKIVKCIIIEDQPPAQRILKTYIENVAYLQLEETFSNAILAVDFIQTTEIDLIFLDIHLPKLSGIDFIKSLPKPPNIILTTAFSDYAIESYELSVIDYLLKPFSFQRFLKAVAKIPSVPNSIHDDASDNKKVKTNSIFIKSGYEYIKLKVDEILYIKSDADYTEIFTSEKKLLANETLKHWEDKLPKNQFTQVHKSYLINHSKISKVTGNQIFLPGDLRIPIGRAYKEEFVKKVLNP